MSRVALRPRRTATLVLFGVIAGVAASAPVAAQQTVTIGVPLFLSFAVTDLGSSTAGTPSPSTVTFSNATLTVGRALRVSVMADAAAFTPPAGPSIPVSKVSWHILGSNGGIGTNGTLSASSFGLVFQANPATASGRVDVAWSLAAPGGGIRAGNHQLTIHWKVESITP